MIKSFFVAGFGAIILLPGIALGQVNTDYLTGDTKLACEALLCFSSSQRPSECKPSIRKYFSIKKKKPHRTRRARKAFLNLCPAAQENAEMQSLVNVIMDAEDRCTAEALNNDTAYHGYIRKAGYDRGHRHYYYEETIERENELPGYCKAYFGHALTDFGNYGITPVYVGAPGKGGFWADYDNRVEAEKRYEAEATRRQQIEENVQNYCKRGCHWEDSSCFDNGR